MRGIGDVREAGQVTTARTEGRVAGPAAHAVSQSACRVLGSGDVQVSAFQCERQACKVIKTILPAKGGPRYKQRA